MPIDSSSTIPETTDEITPAAPQPDPSDPIAPEEPLEISAGHPDAPHPDAQKPIDIRMGNFHFKNPA